MKPLISIIIPTYNRAQIIGETLDSIIAQNYTNWECIVVDDGSTDNTQEILQNYIAKDTRFQYHQRPKDKLKGPNSCRNYGFKLSKGEFINFFDSDDFLKPDAFQVFVNQMNEKDDVDAIISKSELIDFFSRKKLKDLGIPYISILTDPTTGGCAASFSIQGDINIAEPKALIGFAGPRVIEQSIRQTLPEGFQRSEFLLDHGFIDRIVPRHKMKEELDFFIRMFN